MTSPRRCWPVQGQTLFVTGLDISTWEAVQGSPMVQRVVQS